MNYRHAFHAGNFADVLKHIVLCRVLVHLRDKPTAFRVIDTHGGAGLYDLTSDEARRGGEWRNGIARLRGATLAPDVAALLAPYLDIVAALNSGPANLSAANFGATLLRYPGSPALAQALLRPQDRLIACEVEPGAAAALARTLRGDRRCKVLRLDGWMALRAQVPPPERRGVVIIDPPFEQPDEFDTLAETLTAACRKWSSGIFMAWYPVKDRRDPDRLAKKMQQLDIAKLLRVELSIGSAGDSLRLARCGLVIVNPPWTLDRDLTTLLPALAACLSEHAAGATRLDRLGREN
jgi:23S rRNA (adenine2030-N6)-methyltransferase